MKTHTILIECTDEQGLVHKATGVFYHNHLNVLTNHEFVEDETNRFFMRSEISGRVDKDKITNGLQGILPDDAIIRVIEKKPKNVVILVTKEHHCISDLLTRFYFKEMNINILAVIGNHNTLQKYVEKFDIPFHCISHEGKDRPTHEQEVLAKIATYQPDYLILAKYMRVLTPDFVAQYNNRIINIHHSFLPAFIGANPYKQAYQRGVKIIGATAHFVNNHLDEGPILVQEITPTDHSQSAAEMAQKGRDVEKITLAKALQLVFDDRVFVSGNKTIIFD